MDAPCTEFNFDGLVGPTHNYSGLSSGNIASESNKQLQSNPKEAALQGLDKMKALHALGLGQALLPPHERPDILTLRNLGFYGTDGAVLEAASKVAPHLLQACGSASSMWTANAATVCPSADAADGKVHFTPANLNNKLHRTLEPATTTRVLRRIFASSSHFVVHDPLPGCPHLGDEGAANHTRLCKRHSGLGVHLFVYGKSAFADGPAPVKYPARQTREASESVSRLHQIAADAVVLAQQAPAMIDQGVFHNDVISVGNECVFFFHEQAFVDTDAVLKELTHKFERTTQSTLVPIRVTEKQVPVPDAVKSYLFNSQLVTLPTNRMAIVAPSECQSISTVHSYLQSLTAETNNPIADVLYLDVRQSMRNGGGPACLRLRVVLTEEERENVRANIFWTPELDADLRRWINKHYRDRLVPADLADPQLLHESRTALDELTQILKLGSVYPFQLERDAR